MLKVNLKKLENFDNNLELPEYKSLGAAGADLRASFLNKEGISLGPGEKALIPTGLSLEIPQGYEAQVRPRSGLSVKTNLIIPNSPGTIDSDYRGEIKVILHNIGNSDQFVDHGMRIAQLVVAPVMVCDFVEVQSVSATERGIEGFGSTGVN